MGRQKSGEGDGETVIEAADISRRIGGEEMRGQVNEKLVSTGQVQGYLIRK